MNKIACFITCGYTEAGVMQQFLRKINPDFDYHQFLPNKTIKKRGMSKTRSIGNGINGLTGSALLDKTYSIIKKCQKDLEEFSAIIIEDDLDNRFQGWAEGDIQSYQQDIEDHICSLLGRTMSVLFLYASPEIESWFLADWNNSFAYVFGKSNVVVNMKSSVRHFYVHHLKRYISDTILKQHCNGLNDIEMFCAGDDVYVKLSDLLIEAVQTGSKEYIKSLANVKQSYVEQISSSRDLYYSKKFHGEIMLAQLDPKKVADICRVYFRDSFYRLQGMREK